MFCSIIFHLVLLRYVNKKEKIPSIAGSVLGEAGSHYPRSHAFKCKHKICSCAEDLDVFLALPEVLSFLYKKIEMFRNQIFQCC